MCRPIVVKGCVRVAKMAEPIPLGADLCVEGDLVTSRLNVLIKIGGKKERAHLIIIGKELAGGNLLAVNNIELKLLSLESNVRICV